MTSERDQLVRQGERQVLGVEPLTLEEGDLVLIGLPSGREVRGRITTMLGKRADVAVWHKRQPYEIANYPLKWLALADPLPSEDAR